MIDTQTLTSAATIAASSALFAADATQGVDASVWAQGAVMAAGVAVWRVYDRREQAAAKKHATDRREADHAKDARIIALEAKVDKLTDQLIAARWAPNVGEAPG